MKDVEQWSELDEITYLDPEWITERYFAMDVVMNLTESFTVGVCIRCGAMVVGLLSHARSHGDQQA